MPAHRRSGFVTRATEPAISHNPVMKMICGANGTHDGVIASSLSGAQRCAIPAAVKNAARTQRITARAVVERSACESEDIHGRNIRSGPTPSFSFARTSHRIRRNKTADHDAAAVTDIPHHGLADRVAAIADDGARGDRHPLALDRYPIGALAKSIFGAMAIGDVAAGHAVGRDYALE